MPIVKKYPGHLYKNPVACRVSKSRCHVVYHSSKIWGHLHIAGPIGLRVPGYSWPRVSALGTKRGCVWKYALVYVETKMFIGFQWLKMLTVRNDILFLLMSLYSFLFYEIAYSSINITFLSDTWIFVLTDKIPVSRKFATISYSVHILYTSVNNKIISL